MSDIPPEAEQHIAEAIKRAFTAAGAIYDTTAPAAALLAAITEVLPHDPPRRDPASTTSGDFGRATAPRTRHMDQPPPRVPKRAPGFGFGPPPEVTW